VCVIKIEEYFEILEVEAENDLEAKRNAIMQVKDDNSEFCWVESERPRFKAEVVHG
jgi:hypothetical protein